MKIRYFIVLFFAFVNLNCFAQEEGRTSIGVDAGFPTGAAAKEYAFAIGGSLKVESPISDVSLIALSVGYTSISAKKTLIGANVQRPAAIFTPLKVGLKYQLTYGIFAELQTGAAFEIRGMRSTRFIYAPGLVCNINSFDLGVRYEGWVGSGGTISQVAVRLGYRL